MKNQENSNRNIQDYQLLALGERKSKGRPWAILTSDETSQTLGLTLKQTARLFSRLLLKQRIQQLRRGVYLTPGKLPPGKLWQPSPYEVLWAYMNWLGAKWQITGLAAFAKYGFSTQVPQIFTVCNDKLSGEIEAGGSRFTFIKVDKEKLGNTTLFPMIGGIEISFSSKVRTIFDAVYYANRFGSLPSAYTWIAEMKTDQNAIHELVHCCLSYGNKQTLSRIGFVLEKLNIDVTLLINEQKKNTTDTLIPLVPGPRRGKIDRRWGIMENKSIFEIFAELEIPDADDT